MIYKKNVSIDIATKSGELYDYDDSAELEYTIEQDSRSWGIKDIDFTFKGKVYINMWALDINSDSPDRRLDLDFDNPEFVEIVKKEWTPGGVFAPATLYIRLDELNNIGEVIIYSYYLSKPISH